MRLPGLCYWCFIFIGNSWDMMTKGYLKIDTSNLNWMLKELAYTNTLSCMY